MGIFGALTTSVGGLRAESYALENISGNIANSQTTAFKRIDTSFLDLVPQTALTAQIAGGVTAQSRSTNSVQGDVQSASVATFMAINGNGYFIVQKPTNFSGNLPVFGGTDLYTRRGDFQLDQNGYLVNGAGYYLEGIPLDPATGNPTGSIPQTLQFNSNLIPAQETSQVQYNANLPSQPTTTNTESGVAGSNLLNPSTFASNPLVGALTPGAITGSGATVPPTAVTGTAITFPLSTTGTIALTGTGSQTITVNAGDTAAQVQTEINAVTGTTGISATVNGSNQLVLTSQDAETPLNITGGTALGELGLSVSNNGPTDLVTQGVVSSGQQLTVTIGSNPPQTITFGNGPPPIRTLAQLDTALKGLTGVPVPSYEVIEPPATDSLRKLV